MCWEIQRGDIVFPKSDTRSRIEGNIQVVDLTLDPAELNAITALNRDERTGPEPGTFADIP